MKTRINTTFCSTTLLLLTLLLGATTSCKEKELSYNDIIADFLFQYTRLTPQQVTDAVDAEPFAFAGSEPSPGYTLLLDDSTSFVVPKGSAALRLNNITLNVWKAPNSLTFFVAVTDERTLLATVFETWLCGKGGLGVELPPREVQRHISTGYIAGKEAPEHRHKA
ncbi:MAG: hypothetical protein LBB84_13100, partial [Tannerellaceae bacterium]|nr:hypothetical protein [Tannerellaceae bacterium]